MLSIIRQPRFDESLKESIPHALFGPAAKAQIDRIPLSVALVYVAPRAADQKNMQHAVQTLPIIVRGARLPAGGQQPLDDPPHTYVDAFHRRIVGLRG